MTTIGKNMRITVADTQRERVRVLFAEVLGARLEKPKDDLDLFVFEDGFCLGAYVVGAEDALDEPAHMKAPWLEVVVADPDAVARRLETLGMRPFDYVDKTHRYFCPPSGPVFRLARRA